MRMADVKMRYGDRILAFQAAAHRCPELGGQETETTALIRAHMAPLALEELPLGLPTGCAFRLRGGRPGPAVVLRADIDALAVEEPEGRAVRSERPGRMHACGHDVHMAALYGAALALAGRRAEVAGDAVFLFQPAEETTDGAAAVVRGGLLPRVSAQAVFGLHNMPTLPVGTIGVREGPLMAAKDSFQIAVCGRGGHGAEPERCADPVVAAAAIVGALQTIVSRNVAPRDTAVVSVCSIHGGSSDNRIADTVELAGSARTFSEQTGALVRQRIGQVAAACAAAYGCTARVAFPDLTPPVVNAPALLPVAEAAAAQAGRVVRPEPVMISEDFSFYCQQLPAFFLFLGSGRAKEGGPADAPLHSAGFCAHPDTALYGAALLAGLVEEMGRRGA